MNDKVQKKDEYMPIRYEWISELKGNDLLVYGYIYHRVSISDFHSGEWNDQYAIIGLDEMAARLNSCKSAISRSIKRLEKDGYILAKRTPRKTEYGIALHRFRDDNQGSQNDNPGFSE